MDNDKQFMQELKQLIAVSVKDLDSVKREDLNPLLTELSALKEEVSTQSKQYQSSLETLNSSLIQQHNLDHIHQLLVREMVLPMLEVYDSLVSSIQVLEKYKPVKSLFKKSRPRDVRYIKKMKQGQLLIVKRLESQFMACHVHKIDCVGKLFDPKKMLAIESQYDAALPESMVVDEFRSGFFYKDQVLRVAEVKVNKHLMESV